MATTTFSSKQPQAKYCGKSNPNVQGSFCWGHVRNRSEVPHTVVVPDTTISRAPAQHATTIKSGTKRISFRALVRPTQLRQESFRAAWYSGGNARHAGQAKELRVPHQVGILSRDVLGPLSMP